MSRYENVKIKKEKVTRGLNQPKSYNISSNKTIIYSGVPESDSDIWVITQQGDRLDTLASQFYGDVTLWWYIAKAYNLKYMTIPIGTSLRIPGTKQFAIGT